MKRVKYSRNIIAIASLASLACALTPPQAKSAYVIDGETTAYSISNTVEPTEPVCFISESSTYFTSIEGALAVANANALNNTAQTVVVIPNVDSSNAGTPLTWITENCQIGVSSGADVRLVLTADTGCTANPTVGSNAISNDSSSYAHLSTEKRTFADNTSSYINTYLKSNVGIEEDVTVTIESTGELCIGGTVGTGLDANQRPTGHVNGDYCQITMADNSSIISNGGDINLYGYIKETSSDNGSSVIMNSGTMTEPLVFYDYYGGTHSLASYYDVGAFPLNSYDFPCCQVLSRFHYTSTLKGIGGIYMSTKYYISQATLISSSSALFTITDGYIDIKYTPTSFGYTKTPDGTTTTQLTSYSTCALKSMTISVGSYSLNTADYYLPIPYNFNIEIASGKLTISNNVKFLKGSGLTIDYGTKAIFGANVLFYQNNTGYVYQYVVGTSVKLEPASLINNGTLEINSGFAGVIDTTVANATLTTSATFVNSLTQNESGEVHSAASNYQSGTVLYKMITAYAGIYVEDDKNASLVSMQTKTANSFTSEVGTYNGYWKGSTTSEYTNEASENQSKNVSCVLPGTLINMADGTYKKVEDVKIGDEVLVFDHMTGKIGTSVISIADYDPAKEVFVMALNFSNGKTVKVVSEHGFFDVDLNKYIYINEETYKDFIGHRFYAIKGNGSIEKEIVTLESVDTYWLYSETYSPASFKNLNIITEDILSMPGGVTGVFNIFELDENMSVIPELMKQDIEKYGLYEFEEWKEYLTLEEFEAFNVKYVKVGVGKGLNTREGLIQIAHMVTKR